MQKGPGRLHYLDGYGTSKNCCGCHTKLGDVFPPIKGKYNPQKIQYLKQCNNEDCHRIAPIMRYQTSVSSRRLLVPWFLFVCVLLLSCPFTVTASASAATASAPPSLTTSSPSDPVSSSISSDGQAEGESSKNMVVQLVVYLKNSLTRTVQGCGELWTNHGRCNDIRTKIKAHRTTIREHWEDQGFFDNHPQYNPRELKHQLDQITGGISYEEFAFLQKGKEDRGRVLNLLFLVFGAPRFLPYALMFNPEMLPSPLQPPDRSTSENFFEKKSRERSTEILETLLKLEKDAREIPSLAKLNIFGRKKQEQTMKDNQLFNVNSANFMAQHLGDSSSVASHREGALQLLNKLKPHLVSTTEDFSRSEKRLCSVPPSIVKGLANSLAGKGFLSGFLPHSFARGRLLGQLKRVEEADKFLSDNQMDLSKISPRLLREACSDRMIGNPSYTIPELQQSLGDWLGLVSLSSVAPAVANNKAEVEPVTDEAAAASRSTLPPPPQPEESATGVFYNTNLARVALLSYFGMQGTRDIRNEQSALPRLLFSTTAEDEALQGGGKGDKQGRSKRKQQKQKQ